MAKLIRPTVAESSPILPGFTPGYIAIDKGRPVGWFREVSFPFGLGSWFIGVYRGEPISVGSFHALVELVEAD